MSKIQDNTTRQLIYLIACALGDVSPKVERLEGMDLDKLYRLAKAHSLRAITCMALEKDGLLDEAAEETRKRWLEAKNKAIRKNILLDAERAELFRELDARGIWHMLLKGGVLKDLYPQYGMREMVDNDILFDPAFRQQVKELMLARGYRVRSYEHDIDDDYEKPPIYNIEMHTALFNADHKPKEAVSYYANVKERLIRDSEETLSFHFSNEDFYLYFVTHGYKHFTVGGTGLRTLLDIYVLDKVWGKALDWAYIWGEFEKIGCRDYAAQSHDLARKLFAHPETEVALTESELELFEAHTQSGTFGNMENRSRNIMQDMQAGEGRLSKTTRLKYALSRLFPGREWCRKWYPFFYRHPVLLPALWVYRAVRSVALKPRKLLREWRSIWKPQD